MLGWLIKRSVSKKFSEIDNAMKNSFTNLRDDMDQVSQWVSHFKEKHEKHDTVLGKNNSRLSAHEKEISSLNMRLEQLEMMMEIKHAIDQPAKESQPNPIQSTSEILAKKESLREDMPPSQYRVCRILAFMQELDSKKWTSQKDLASEMYKDKEYIKCRSAIAQLVNILEADGYLLKKKVQRSVYVQLREGSIPLFLDERIKNSDKKK